MMRAIERDPLLAGFYSIGDATRLLGVSHAAKLRGWINGWPNSKSGPIVERDFKQTATVSFLDLMELRFIEYFRSQGVSMPTLRKAADLARQEWSVQHPFALSDVKYLTDRRKVMAQASKAVGDKPTWELVTGQYLIWDAIEASIAKGVVFDPATHLALRWKPRPGDHPDIVLDPARAFGKPLVDSAGIPTDALFRQWKAEDGSFEKVARWFNVSREQVENAVRFELELAN
ncbi:DUF433 domain-containing protein [Sphingomonas sp. 35-24ZXX]|uniref:DUF433 domain-containing protein n=1 Tax=Sphingomonas sp. 35-24ZXX TaxID=1545915 RepID=UPI0018CCEA6C|nr:DUF433 domain-containing protein [Sphingomonas sp. 35-24ZXX]